MSSQQLIYKQFLPLRTFLIVVMVYLCAANMFAQSTTPIRLYVRFHSIPPVTSSVFDVKLPYGGNIVKPLLRPEQAISYQQTLMMRSQTASEQHYDWNEVRHAEETLLRTFVIEYDGTISYSKYSRMIPELLPDVELVAPVNICTLQFTPNDPLVSSQSYLATMNVLEAWDIERGDSSVIIGITDSGLRTTHEDLSSKIAVNKGEIPNNNVDDDNNGYVDDYMGFNLAWKDDNTARDNVFNPNNNHGTCVAGIIGAEQDNNRGISGISGRCKILSAKATRNNNNAVVYGYESIIYAVVRGCKVINCSWGNDAQVFNPVEQSIIDFAISRDAAVVVSAGNIKNEPTDPFFPAAYRGVLSVGETYDDGGLTVTSSYGAHCSIVAPGNNARTTDNSGDGSYTSFNGTSSAAPMVTGVVALVRSKFPNLTALQALEHVRHTSRSVTDKNPLAATLVPGMVDAKAALSTEPFSRPSLRAISYSLRASNGQPISRIRTTGDTVRLSVTIKNYLGNATNCRFVLSVVEPTMTQTPVQVLDSVVTAPILRTGEEVSIGSFSFITNQIFSTRVFLRLAITADNGYTDVALLDYLPIIDYQNIGNTQIVCSFGDYGWIGTNTLSDGQRKGLGYSFNPFGNLLYRGGIVLTDEVNAKVRSGISSDISALNNSFDVLSVGGRPYSILLSDMKKAEQQRIGMDVRQSILIPDDTGTIIQSNIRIVNRTATELRGIAVGCFFDWDITVNADSNQARYFPEGVLNSADPKMAAELMKRTPRNAVVGAAVITTEADGIAQAAGLDESSTSGGFPDDKIIESLNKGTAKQTTAIGDLAMMIGMRYTNAIKPGEERLCTICFGAAPNEDELAVRLKSCLQNRILSVEHHTTITENVMISPHPVETHFNVIGDGISSIRLYTVLGALVLQQDDIQKRSEIDVRMVPSGIYMLALEDINNIISITPLLIQR